jgi:hypothetical protein
LLPEIPNSSAIDCCYSSLLQLIVVVKEKEKKALYSVVSFRRRQKAACSFSGKQNYDFGNYHMNMCASCADA